MSYSVPDPRWEMPELLIPGRKPVGNVVIDWSHKAARGLVSYKPLSNSQGVIDLVDGSGGVVTGAGIGGNRPNCFHADINVSKVIFDKNVGDYLGTRWTMMFTIEHVAVALHSRFTMGDYTDGSYNWAIYHNSSGFFKFFFDSGTASLIIASIKTPGDKFTCIVTCNNGAIYSYCTDGTENNATPTNKDVTSDHNFGIGQQWYSGIQENNYYQYAAWNYSLPVELIRKLLKDSYQFLIPA